MTLIAPFGRYRAFDNNGNPLAGGKLYTYEAGTSTPKATYTSKDGLVANTNPVILDADGYADVWLDTGGYKFTLKTSGDVLLWTKDDIDGGSASGFGSQVISRSASFSLTVNEKNYVVVCTSALTVSLLAAATAGDGYLAMLVNTGSGNVTIDPDGSETINGAASLVLQPGSSTTIHTDGINWYAGIGEKGSVALSMPAEFSVSGSPVNGQGTLTVSKATQTANRVFAGPNSGAAAQPTFRVLAQNDLPARTQTVLTSGTSWNVPSNVAQVFARVWGGGGGGGGAAAGNTLQGAGGGSGGYSEGLLTVTPGGTVSYAVGAAGTGGTAGANTGTAGGNSTFSTLTANGGAGGSGGSTFGTSAAGGAGGTASGGTLNQTGRNGNAGLGESGSRVISGQGADAPQGIGFGGLARSQENNTQGTGYASIGYASGGAGGYSTGTAQAGGNGTQGVIILEY